MVLINLCSTDNRPMYQQVFDQIKDKIDKQVIQPGYRLPSTRSLADSLGVNRTTIYKAYQELWALGYIESRSGSYSFVRQKRDIVKSDDAPEELKIDWDKKLSANTRNIYKLFCEINYPFSEKTSSFDGIDMGRLHPDTRLFPIEQYRSSLNRVLTEKGESLLDYGETFGYKPLREFISNRLQQHGVKSNFDEVIITNGAQNAIDLLMKLFAFPGARVFVESPTYGMIIPTLKFYECEIVSIPINENGVDLLLLENELQKGLPIFFYTMPNFQNPTGITSTQENREKLLELFEKYKVPIIEDAFEEEMKYFGKVPLPIKAMDNNRIVIYIGSFSKILFPGIRLGWIAADKELINRIASVKRFSDLSTALPEQAALAEFCIRGQYEIHIKRIHKIFRKRMITAIQTLSSSIDNKVVSWNEPNGGYTIWLKLHSTKKTYSEINELLLANKVRLALGKDFFPYKNNEIYLRLSIAGINEDEIVEGIRRFVKTIKQIYRKK